MQTAQQLNITLPEDMASGESEVVRDGLYALLEREHAVEYWLHAEVGPGMR